MPDAPLLIIPVESQVREMDAKLLLASCAVERGYRVVIGSRAYVHFAMAELPRGVYAAKSMRGLSKLMFRLIRELGHDIIAWEEEALVHPPPEVFYPLRLSPGTLPYVSHIFAWGEENRELLAGYPHLPKGMPMHLTGNPRGDMLRPELRAYFDDDVRALKQQYGDFLLINTNFTDVNPFQPGLGLFAPSTDPTKPPPMGQAGKGMPRAFAEGLLAHKQSILDDFLAMMPALEQALPGVTLVLRPHPSENHAVYQELARRCSRIVVSHQGNVLPWLLACRALVHNGCTTAIESYAMGVPSVTYLKTFNTEYDLDFQGLPNRLSVQCRTLDELIASLKDIIENQEAARTSAERDALIGHYITARSGRLACERILDQLDAIYRREGSLPLPPLPVRLRAWLHTRLRSLAKRRKHEKPGNYHDHRFPRLSTDDVARRIEKLGRTLGRFGSVGVRTRSEHLFEVFAKPRTEQ
ncbi:surface carbohydrate biosynthesis protein [Hydrocarboniphaga effusa]|uniref:surface carbohydrate biosynthesis protein n=2 Tax=Hydrocarboniphaga effusa TaxID=243629 RepID=UPI0031384225